MLPNKYFTCFGYIYTHIRQTRLMNSSRKVRNTNQTENIDSNISFVRLEKLLKKLHSYKQTCADDELF